MVTRGNGGLAKGERAYVLQGPDCLPFYVGEGRGDLNYRDALMLSENKMAAHGVPAKERAARLASAGFSTADAAPRSRPVPSGSWKDHRGTSKKTGLYFRASKNNPYVCDYCGHRTARYSNMITHLEKIHNDYGTDPRQKAVAIRDDLVGQLKKPQGS